LRTKLISRADCSTTRQSRVHIVQLVTIDPIFIREQFQTTKHRKAIREYF